MAFRLRKYTLAADKGKVAAKYAVTKRFSDLVEAPLPRGKVFHGDCVSYGRRKREEGRGKREEGRAV